METYIAIDLETTGLSPKLDRIVEIGAVRVEDGQITDELKLFVDPGRELPARITELTGHHPGYAERCGEPGDGHPPGDGFLRGSGAAGSQYFV